MEIKIKWIKRKQMTHENTYRDDNTYVGQILKKNAQYIFYLHIFIYLIDREKGGGSSAYGSLSKYTHFSVIMQLKDNKYQPN